MPELSTLSTRELLQAFRNNDNPIHRAAVLNLLAEKNPYITHFAKTYTVAVPTQIRRLLPSTNPQKNQFLPVAEIAIGKSFALTTGFLPNGATVDILEEDLHQQAPKPAIGVARVKIIKVIAQQDQQKIGQISWTTRSNISAESDPLGHFKIIKPTANIRKEPVPVLGAAKLAPGRRVYIDEVKIDDYINRDTFGLAVDADTHQEYGWISTTALSGKMDSEIFGLREAPFQSTEIGHNTVGDQAAAILVEKGLHFAIKETVFPQHTQVKIIREAVHLGAKGTAKVAEIQSANHTVLGWTTRSNISSQPLPNGFLEITAPDASVRSAPLSVYAVTDKLLPQGALVQVLETASALQLNTSGQFESIAVSKVSVIKNGKTDPKFENLWTLSANLVAGWADFKGPNARWTKGDYIGQTAVLDVIGGEGTGGKQIAMSGGLGLKVVQMLSDARQANIPLSINSGFRDYAKQVQLARDQPGNAAKPGRSDHQGGNAMDLNNKNNKQVYEWLRQNAWKYGLVQTYPWFLGTDGSGGEGHHWDYRPNLAQEGFYTFFIDRFDPGVTFGLEPGEVDPRVKSTETWITGNAKGFGKGKFRIMDTVSRKIVKLRKN